MTDDAFEEVPLTGGNMDTDVVKVGDTVRRSTGSWTPAVHRLLRHLEVASFPGSPRAIGTDEQGREILTFIPGVVIWPNHFDIVRSDEALTEVATLISEYHATVADLAVDPGDHWRDIARDPHRPPEVICHNDLAPWNLVHTTTGWCFIDWDLAAPGRRYWDLAWAVHTFVPCWPNSGIDDAEVIHRIRLLCDAYGVPSRDRAMLMHLVAERVRREADELRVRALRGEQPWQRLVDEGHLATWESAATYVDAHLDRWTRMLKS